MELLYLTFGSTDEQRRMNRWVTVDGKGAFGFDEDDLDECVPSLDGLRVFLRLLRVDVLIREIDLNPLVARYMRERDITHEGEALIMLLENDLELLREWVRDGT